MGLAIMMLGLAVFIGAHAFVTRRGERAALIARMGEGGYKSLFSLVSIVGVVLIAWGFARYRATGWIDIWYPPLWTRHITVLLMWIASICIVAAYSPGRIKTTLKHPMLVGTKTWAAAHLISNGDLGSIILFGSILGWAVFDRFRSSTAPIRAVRPSRSAGPGRTSSRSSAARSSICCSASCSTRGWSGCRRSAVNRCAVVLPCARHIASLPPRTGRGREPA